MRVFQQAGAQSIVLLLSVGMLVSCGQQPSPPQLATPPAASAKALAQEPCRSAETQAQMTRCWSEAAVTAERASVEAYDNVVHWLQQRQQPEVVRMFGEAQARWEAYREAQCEGVSAVYENGSMAALQRAQCRVRLAEQRQRELEVVISDANN